MVTSAVSVSGPSLHSRNLMESMVPGQFHQKKKFTTSNGAYHFLVAVLMYALFFQISVIGTACIVYGAGSVKPNGVRLSVAVWVTTAVFAAVAWPAEDIDYR